MNSNWYFRPRKIEAAIYEKLGVRRFKRYMLFCFGGSYASQFDWHPIRDGGENLKKTLISYKKQTRKNESFHIIALLVILLLAINLIIKGNFPHALVLVSINIPFNFYPVMLQRHTRFRLHRVLKKI